MAYDTFTFDQLRRQFNLEIAERPALFGDLKPVTISALLRQTLDEGAPLAIAMSTEKARSELIVAPVLMEVRRQCGGRVGLFSGMEFTVDRSQGLTGFCDFLMTASSSQMDLRAPVLAVVEAKNDNIRSGVPQCIAEMHAAAIFNARDGQPKRAIFGDMTNGSLWTFLTLRDAQVVIDLANSPNFADDAVLAFFRTSGGNLMAAEAKAGVRHHVALSVVGSDRLPDSGYLRAKLIQEELIKESGIPYTIIRSTQFFEFLGGIAQSASDGDTVRLSPAHLQPVASDDVAALVAKVAMMAPANGVIELAGPERIGLDDLVRRYLAAKNDARKVVTDVHARYFGAELNDKSLTPGANPHIGSTSFQTWLGRATAAA